MITAATKRIALRTNMIGDILREHARTEKNAEKQDSTSPNPALQGELTHGMDIVE